jgi:hypothetical protein
VGCGGAPNGVSSRWLTGLWAASVQAESLGAVVDPAISSVASELVAIEEGMARGAWRAALARWRRPLC